LASLGIHRIALNTNNPQKIDALRKRGIDVVEVVPSLTEPNEHNEGYLRTKAQQLGHVSLALGMVPPAAE
jgi:GTP cyclohydrolase II